jgi:apolipoprotein N-acyltransferase
MTYAFLMSIQNTAKRYSLSILSGILIGTSYIPFPPWAIFFCFVPLWIEWLGAKSAKQIFISGWIAQFILTAIGFNWVAHTVHEYGFLPWPIAIGVLFLFCAVANLQIPIAGLVWFKLFRRQPLALPFILAASERLYPMIFDWHFGYTWLWARFPAFHLGDIIGFVGLSSIGIFINYLLLNAVLLWRAGKPPWRPVAGAVTSLLVLNVAGYWHGQQLEKPDKSIKVLIVQANVGNKEKSDARAGSANSPAGNINRFLNLTDEALKQVDPPDFAMWPETAFQEVVVDSQMRGGYAEVLSGFLKSHKLNLVTGAYSRLGGTGQYTNSLFAFNAEGVWAAPPYHKTVLLAFGEYFPGANLFPVLKTWFPEVGDYGRGMGPMILTLNNLRLGAQICYEGLFDWFTRSLANKGAQVIVNVTNDGWYDLIEQPRQHGWMTLSRAIEVRRPLVRSTNTGISMAILADGTILERSPLHQEWFHLYQIPYVENPRATIFMSWGYWLIPVILILGILLLFGRELRLARTDAS